MNSCFRHKPTAFRPYKILCLLRKMLVALKRASLLVTPSGTVSSPKNVYGSEKSLFFFIYFKITMNNYYIHTTTTNVNYNDIETTKCPSRLLKLQNVHLCYRNYKNVHLGYIHTSSSSSITNVLHSSNSTTSILRSSRGSR